MVLTQFTEAGYAMCSVVFASWWCCGLQAARLLCPWDSPGKILEWVAMPSSRGSSRLRAQTRVSFVSCIAGGFLTHWVIQEAQRRAEAQLDIAWPISGRLRIQTQVAVPEFLLLKLYAFFPLPGSYSDLKLQEQDLFWYISHITCRISLQECHWEEASGRLLAILQSHDYVLKDILWKSSGHKL